MKKKEAQYREHQELKAKCEKLEAEIKEGQKVVEESPEEKEKQALLQEIESVRAQIAEASAQNEILQEQVTVTQEKSQEAESAALLNLIQQKKAELE